MWHLPLNELVKKNVAFTWGEKQEEAFALLKEKHTKAPVLLQGRHPDRGCTRIK